MSSQALERHAVNLLGIGAGLAHGAQFAVELGLLRFRRGKKIGIEPAEIAFDAVLLDDAFDAVDSGGVALPDRAWPCPRRGSSRTTRPCRRRSATDARWCAPSCPCRFAAVDNDHVDVAQRQFVGRREAGNPAADDHDAGSLVLVQGFGVRMRRRCRPIMIWFASSSTFTAFCFLCPVSYVDARDEAASTDP